MKAKLFGQIHDLVSNSLIITAAETKVRYNEVEILPAADYDTQQAAIAAAVTTLQFALIDARRVGDTVACHAITEALAQLRAAKEER